MKSPTDQSDHRCRNRGSQTTRPRFIGICLPHCLAYELRKRGFKVVEEQPVPVMYDDVKLECGFRADLVVNGQVVVELKAKSAIHPVDKAQVLSHLRLLNLRFGLLVNFHEERVVDGISRIVNGYGND